MNDALVAQISAAGLVSSTPPERQLSWLGLRPTSGSLVLSYLQLESCAWKATKQHLYRPPLDLRSKKQKTSNFCPVAPCFFSRTIHNGLNGGFSTMLVDRTSISSTRSELKPHYCPYIFWGLGLSNKLNFNVVVFFDRTWLKEDNLGGWFSTLMAFDLSNAKNINKAWSLWCHASWSENLFVLHDILKVLYLSW